MVALVGLSVVLPAYNEGSSVAGVVSDVLAVLDDFYIDGEVVVVDDGSTDDTGRRLGGVLGDSRVRLISHQQNRGKGAAIRSGVEASRGCYVLIHDCDGEYSCDDIGYLFSAVESGAVDVCFGSRLWHRPRMRRLHFVGNRMISGVASLFLPVRVSDVMTGHKLFWRGLIDASQIRCSGFDVEVELTFLLLRALRSRGSHDGYYEVPISYGARDRGSKLRKIDGVRSLLRIAREVIRH